MIGSPACPPLPRFLQTPQHNPAWKDTRPVRKVLLISHLCSVSHPCEDLLTHPIASHFLSEPLATACQMPFGNLSRLQQPYHPCAPLLTPSKNTSGFARCHFSLPSRAGSSLVHRHGKGDKGSCWVPVPSDGRGAGSVGVFQVIWKHPRAVLATGSMPAATQPPCWRESARPCPGEEPFLGMGHSAKGVQLLCASPKLAQRFCILPT